MITYALEPGVSPAEFHEVLVSSTLAERRPTDDLGRLNRMLRNADIIIAARHGRKLIGISRAVTDFCYCCYLSDLAVDRAYQGRGIGRRLIDETRQHAGEEATLVLVAAPAAHAYYPKIGMKHEDNCWAIPRLR